MPSAIKFIDFAGKESMTTFSASLV